MLRFFRINNTCILWQEGFNVTTDVTINGLSGVTQSCDDLEDVSSSSDDYWKKRIPQPFDNCGTKVKMDGNVSRVVDSP